jgi:hypothetical protein
MDKIDTLVEETIGLHRVWGAVFSLGLQDAAVALKKLSPCATPERAMNANEPLRWVYSDAEFPGSFVWLCHMTHRDPADARAKWISRARLIAAVSKQSSRRRSLRKTIVQMLVEEAVP